MNITGNKFYHVNNQKLNLNFVHFKKLMKIQFFKIWQNVKIVQLMTQATPLPCPPPCDNYVILKMVLW